METSLLQTKNSEKEKKKRLHEIEDDLDQTESLFKQNRNPRYREAINNLRYILIVEKHSITNPKFEL